VNERIVEALRILCEEGVEKVFIIAEDTASVYYDETVVSDLPSNETFTF
jgi:hypothetical protein